MGVGCGEMDEEVWGLRSTNWYAQNSHRNVKYSIGNGVAKGFIYMTHGHEERCGHCLRDLGVLGGGGHSGKNWNNFNGIINKI